ncbi:hypothetical protein B0H10DRAFT_2215170 [Mycena sp. CBHHK59/15]|nr:hypothetical protein B0H10DRAFT_2215170 [Mycena sp. CBHHK59/15]
MPDRNAADWTTHPEDFTHALQFLHDQKSRISDGGNFDKTVMNEAAVYMAENWPPQASGPKTANSIMTKWKAVRGNMAQFLSDDNFQLHACKLHEYILQAKQKRYPGASGWTYTDELGFNVTDNDQDAWKKFAKAHQHFKPFATCGWIHFKTVDEIIPLLACGHYVFHGGATQPAHPAPVPPEQSQDDGDEQPSDPSQPFLDWSQSNYGESQPPNLVIPMLPPQPSQSTVAHRVPATVPTTSASTSKRMPSDDVEAPWSNKCTRTTGPEPLVALLRASGR